MGTELNSFDIIIFQNFNFHPYGVFNYHLKKLKEFVSVHGGAFLMIGGKNSFKSGNYAATPISDILPFELDFMPQSIDQTYIQESFKAVVLPSAYRHPILQITHNDTESGRIWETLTELEGLNTVAGLKNGAIAMLRTDKGYPLFAVTKYKTGKVGAFLSDSSWKWNFIHAGGGNISPYYENFWNRLILWFVNDPDLKDIRVSSTKYTYNPGENQKIDVFINQNDLLKEDIKLNVITPWGEDNDLKLEKMSEGNYNSEFAFEVPGVYKIKAAIKKRSGDDADIYTDSNMFLIEPPENEITGPTQDIRFLQELSKFTGGRFITIKDSPSKIDINFSPRKRMSGYETISLWHNPIFFSFVIFILSLEWILRRRWGLN